MSKAKFATDGTMGVAFDAQDTTPQFRLGHSVFATDNSELMYCYFPAAVTGSGFAVQIDPTTFSATMITTTNALRGAGVGVSCTSQPGGTWGWVQTYGPAQVQVTANTTANSQLSTTAVAGQLSSATTAGTKQVVGLTLLAARGGTDGQALGNVNGPLVGASN